MSDGPPPVPSRHLASAAVGIPAGLLLVVWVVPRLALPGDPGLAGLLPLLACLLLAGAVWLGRQSGAVGQRTCGRALAGQLVVGLLSLASVLFWPAPSATHAAVAELGCAGVACAH